MSDTLNTTNITKIQYKLVPFSLRSRLVEEEGADDISTGMGIMTTIYDVRAVLVHVKCMQSHRN